MAKTAGMPDKVAERIAGAGSAVNVADLEESNFGYLYGIDSMNTGTPTVYDVQKDEKVDIFDNDWLTKMMQT
jgi:hypothetical protein